MAHRKETALDLAKFIDKGVRVKLAGGREGTCTRIRDVDASRGITQYCTMPPHQQSPACSRAMTSCSTLFLTRRWSLCKVRSSLLHVDVEIKHLHPRS